MKKRTYKKLASISRQVNEGYNKFAERHGWPTPKFRGRAAKNGVKK